MKTLSIYNAVLGKLTVEQLTNYFKRVDYQQCQTKSAIIQQILEQYKPEQIKQVYDQNKFKLGPVDIEEILQCSATEVKRWTDEDKLFIVDYQRTKSAGKTHLYPVFDASAILSIDPNKIEEWRTEYKNKLYNNHRTNKPKNTALKSVIDEYLKDTDTRTKKIYELALWTYWIDYWHTTYINKLHRISLQTEKYQEKANNYLKCIIKAFKKFQELGIDIKLSQPRHPDKVYIEFCPKHWQEILDNNENSLDNIDLYYKNPDMYDKCPDCIKNIEKNYHSLYFVEINFEDLPISFCFTLPYHTCKLNVTETITNENRHGCYINNKLVNYNSYIVHSEIMVNKAFNASIKDLS